MLVDSTSAVGDQTQLTIGDLVPYVDLLVCSARFFINMAWVFSKLFLLERQR